MKTTYEVNKKRLAKLLAMEEERFIKANPKSEEIYKRAQRSLVRGVPMHWMDNWPSPFPLHLKKAFGASLADVDGHEYIDFCLGDTGAMFGHGNEEVAAAVQNQITQGSTTMLPTEDAFWAGENLQQRFGLPYWQLATSATDANRFAIRMSRIMTGRDKILVFNGKYHGSLDETQVSIEDGKMVPQPRISSNAVDFERTTKVIEFNDLEALEKALAPGDVACVLTEPIMTNVGMVPPEPGFHKVLRDITRRTGTLLIMDETHTISTSPSGYTGAYGLEPDFFVLGKAIAGGIPAAVYGMTEEVARAMRKYTKKDGYSINHCGFGGTLAGNALTVHALRATLEKVMTEENYNHMTMMAEKFEQGVTAVIQEKQLPWHVTRIGARVEYMFSKSAPTNGGEAKAIREPELEAAIHLYLLNRGVLLTPFHSMALMCPYTEEEDVKRHTQVFRNCIEEIV
ncbi:glutamate-1-semialdehyde 2,1-aminomutase [Scopulibacillus darangshiensis]|uniref:Glutamate-1-semialdehyde 2,1-aminomutase n=1 Tax=Scopulibacillus darangshiensis TaxID=442528 RepID=A0A4R2P7H4_9BACL|nr:aspartate aminotransferase family protein [Scopulibacillus darangshiensis]TCP30889.1 glutamate-1-semialdehyde 2,1-aminomutase [Scopulibacillus darangshiensis]